MSVIKNIGMSGAAARTGNLREKRNKTYRKKYRAMEIVKH